MYAATSSLCIIYVSCLASLLLLLLVFLLTKPKFVLYLIFLSFYSPALSACALPALVIGECCYAQMNVELCIATTCTCALRVPSTLDDPTFT